MNTYSFEYQFNRLVCKEIIQENLETALLVAEVIFGRPRVMTDLDISFDHDAKTVHLTGFGDVGQIVNTVFLGLVQNSCGEKCYQRIRLEPRNNHRRRSCRCKSKAKARGRR